MARYIQVFMCENPDIHQKSILIIVPNRSWALLAKKALQHHKFEVTLGGVRLGLSSTVRGTGYSAKRTHGLLKLLSQSQESLETNHFNEQERAFYLQKSQLKGFSLAKAVELENLKDYEEVLKRMSGDETPGELLALFESAAFNPVFREDQRAVRIATIDYDVQGSYDLVWILGAVDGFIPPASSGKGSAKTEPCEYRSHFARALKIAANTLMVSFFSQIEQDKAQRLNLPYARTRLADGVKIALCKPSPFILDPSFALPSTVGGQAFLDNLRN